MRRKPLVIHFDKPEWNIESADEFERLLAPSVNAREVIIDLSTIAHIDSVCLTKLVALYRRRVVQREYPPSHLVIASPALLRRFSVAGFDNLWLIHATLAEAVAAVEADGYSRAPASRQTQHFKAFENSRECVNRGTSSRRDTGKD
jgi:anti-anti-sigma regulatory factor